MTGIVIDASIVVAAIMPDKDAVRAGPVFTRIGRIGEGGAVVPSLWRLEVANALLMAERRRRIDPVRRREGLALIAALPIEVDLGTWDRAWHDILPLAARFRLTAYDAAYLELAQRIGLPLATLDEDLGAAAAQLGVGLAAE
jgi:predicted nucleic acid-binding protein